jgi:hypothetical protein
VLPGHAGEAGTVRSEMSEVIAGLDPVQNALTYSDAEAANLDVAIAFRPVSAICWKTLENEYPHRRLLATRLGLGPARYVGCQQQHEQHNHVWSFIFLKILRRLERSECRQQVAKGSARHPKEFDGSCHKCGRIAGEAFT